MSGIYIHIPFCKKACHYCNFHFSTNQNSKSEFIKAVCQELILRKSEHATEEIQSIYFGGGTPSLLEVSELNTILQIIEQHYKVCDSSNLFHALFLVLFIVLFSTELTRIPLTALMAILVYTGYKLASPDVVRRIFTIGKEQLIIFFATLFVTLKVGLITGIVAGLIATFVIHIVVTKSLSLFVKNILKPNVLMFKEENGGYFISVKHFCSFLNFNMLKSKLEAIPEESDVILDFSLCGFVDHSVMENVHDYQELFHKKGGNIGVIGLDILGTKSEHPFALRRLLPIQNIITNNKTKRQNNLEQVANDFGLRFDPLKHRTSTFLENFIYFKTKKVEHVFNQLSAKDSPCHLFDVTFSEGEFIAKEVIRSTMLHIKTSSNVRHNTQHFYRVHE